MNCSGDLRPNQTSPYTPALTREGKGGGRIGVGLGLPGRLLPCHRSQALSLGNKDLETSRCPMLWLLILAQRSCSLGR